MYYIYTLKSDKDNNLYIGCTCNLLKRFKEHCSGKVKSTKYRLPVRMIYSEKYCNRYIAFQKERYYKTSKGKKELKNKILISAQSCGIV
ncbi:GIY-YIG nuclease family protein [Candidatus Parcubacteria bacterium]|nr:GIY-YIG nuclease family protein [Candidatus Parcubacteria bacterium]